jgi:hypothetical protein
MAYTLAWDVKADCLRCRGEAGGGSPRSPVSAGQITGDIHAATVIRPEAPKYRTPSGFLVG